MMRQKRKQILTISLAIALSLAVFALPVAVPAASLVTTVVTDPLTGVALEGYDPVTYFTEPDPQPGQPDFEYQWGGVPWYFTSAANRDVFIRNPEVYAPQFGGHCVMSLSRGYLSDGKPRLYLIDGMKLYLFYSVANRDAFLQSDVTSLREAQGNWVGLAEGLTGQEASVADAVGDVVAGEEAPKDGEEAPAH